MIYETHGLPLISTVIYVLLIFLSVIIAIMGSLIIIPFFTRRAIDEKKEIVKNRNIGIALVLGSFIWTIGRMCFETIHPMMDAWYSKYSVGFDFKSLLSLILGIIGSLLIALIIGALTVYLSIKLLMVLTRDINEWEEIKDGNIAVAIVLSVTVIVVGMFFESLISYIVANLFSI